MSAVPAPPADPPRPAAEVLAWSRALIGPALRAAVDAMPDGVRAVAAYRFGWQDEHGRPSAGRSDGVAAAAVRTLARAVLDLVEGQCADVAFEERTDVDVPECLRMAGRKTGALVAASCALGAAYAGAEPPRVGALRRFGERIGLAFQLVDDLLGIWGDPAVTGKPVHSDLRSRKKSLPVVAALASGTRAGDALSRLYLRDGPISEEEAARAAALVDEAGGRAWARRRACRLKAEAFAALDAAAPADRPRAELRALADLVTDRDH